MEQLLLPQLASAGGTACRELCLFSYGEGSSELAQKNHHWLLTQER